MMTYEQAIIRLAERLADRREESKRIQLQRRNQVVDVYGMEYTRQGDGDRPATFYLYISPDLIYFERFEFKIIIEGFRTPIAETNVIPDDEGRQRGIEFATVEVQETTLNLVMENADLSTDPTSLEVEDETLSIQNNMIQPSSHGHPITPDPHHHTILPHSHGIPSHRHAHTTTPHTHIIHAGMSYFDIEAADFSIFIEGIDLTPYFQAQFPFTDGWVNGEGVFPKVPREHLANYDVLEAFGYMMEISENELICNGSPAASRPYCNACKECYERILTPGYKKVQICGDGPFNATLVSYLKYSHVNR